MAEPLTLEDFRPLLGDVFTATPHEGDPFELVLSQAERWGGGSPIGRPPFQLLFHASHETQAPQQTFTLAHATLGEFPLFLEPIGPDERGMRYQAVFG